MFFEEIEKLLLSKIHTESQGTLHSQNILKKNKVRGFTLPDSKTYYEAREIKTVWYWCEDRYIGQWNRIESPEKNLHIYG